MRKRAIRLLMVVPYFPPDRGPIPTMYGGLASDLAQAYEEVLVITGQPNYASGVKRSSKLYQIERAGKEKIVRVFVPKLNRENVCSRLAAILTYNLLGAAYVLLAADSDVALMTNPALEVWLIALIVRLKRIPFHYRVHDLYPEIAVRLGFLRRKSLLARAIERIERLCLKSAGTVSVVTTSFQSFLGAEGIDQGKLTVVPDWVDTVQLCNLPKKNMFSQWHNLAEKFVIGYGGNIGRSQGLDVLVEAASLLSDEREIVFLIVGEGAKKLELMSLCHSRKLENVIFMPYQPDEILREVYATWDVGFVSLIPGLSPEWQTAKIFSIMASSRPVLATADLGGEVHKAIEKTACGICIQSGNATNLAQTIREMFANRDQLAALGANGRQAVERNYSRKLCTQRLESLVACLVTSPHL